MVARIAFAVHEYDLHIRVIDQDPEHFAAGITRAANYACFYFRG
jgi:hypothetical protein